MINLVTPEEKQRRLKACTSCSFYVKKFSMMTCNKGCGCVGVYKTKLNRANGKCPEGKW